MQGIKERNGGCIRRDCPRKNQLNIEFALTDNITAQAPCVAQ
jgi:hypothetical protein